MDFGKTKIRRVSLELFLFLASFALILDFTIGLVPFLGAFIGFLFAFIVRWQLGFFDYTERTLFRFIIGVAAPTIWELIFSSVSPTNFIFVVVTYVFNLRKTYSEEKKLKEMAAANDNKPRNKKLAA